MICANHFTDENKLSNKNLRVGAMPFFDQPKAKRKKKDNDSEIVIHVELTGNDISHISIQNDQSNDAHDVQNINSLQMQLGELRAQVTKMQKEHELTVNKMQATINEQARKMTNLKKQDNLDSILETLEHEEYISADAVKALKVSIATKNYFHFKHRETLHKLHLYILGISSERNRRVHAQWSEARDIISRVCATVLPVSAIP